jgi:hypothetical protein
MTTSRCLAALIAASVSLAATGCGKPAMVPVQGKVTFRGYTINNGLIVFTPEARGPLAVGRIREDGVFALYTGDNPGAHPGNYRVTVTSLSPGSSSESWGRFEFPRSALPDKFRDVEQSRLVCEVKASRSNTFDVDLTE